MGAIHLLNHSTLCDLGFDVTKPIAFDPHEKWTPRSVQLLRKLIEEGKTASAVASELSKRTGETFTRNAILGKSRRLQIELKGLPKFRKKRRPRKIIRLKPEMTLPKPVPVSAPPAVTIEEPLMLSITEMRQGQCYWPTGNGAVVLFCGRPTTDEHCSWCPGHRRLGYRLSSDCQRIRR